MINKNLSRKEKLNILYGGGSAVELVRARAVRIENMGDLLANEQDLKGKLSEAPEYVEADNKLYEVDQFPDGQPAGIAELMGVLNEFETVVVYSQNFFDAFMKH